MFGILRYLLALLVAINHLWFDRWYGFYAVFGFYLLSGYLMTLVLTTTYAASWDGLRRYFGNRALRIYPAYLAFAFLGLSLAALEPELARGVHRAIFVPEAPLDWLKNLSIFGLLNYRPPRLVPPAWSLHVELVFYVLMGLGLSRWRSGALLWLGASVAYTGYLLQTGADWQARYFSVFAASLPFSMGAVLCHFRAHLAAWADARLAIAAVVAFLVNTLWADHLWGWVEGQGFYASLVLVLASVACLASLDPSQAPSWLRRCDRWLGDLAYGVFLCHYAAAIAVRWLFGGHLGEGLALLAASVGGFHLLAWLGYVLVERPVGGLRDRLRPARRPVTPPARAGSDTDSG
ncbi:MAG: hypothetical protein CL910_01300 [Deltaproteobacteria bacterium]|nr:hypothetical protein [Deltaproteobacteria bacterium]